MCAIETAQLFHVSVHPAGFCSHFFTQVVELSISLLVPPRICLELFQSPLCACTCSAAPSSDFRHPHSFENARQRYNFTFLTTSFLSIIHALYFHSLHFFCSVTFLNMKISSAAPVLALMAAQSVGAHTLFSELYVDGQAQVSLHIFKHVKVPR